MKKNDESGFILMIVILLAIAIFVIGFAVYRIVEANKDSSTDAANTQKSFYVASAIHLS